MRSRLSRMSWEISPKLVGEGLSLSNETADQSRNCPGDGGGASRVDGFFAMRGDPWCPRRPLMHQTPTTGYSTVLSGQVSLLLEAGKTVPLQPFDSAVQRMNHQPGKLGYCGSVTVTWPFTIRLRSLGPPHSSGSSGHDVLSSGSRA